MIHPRYHIPKPQGDFACGFCTKQIADMKTVTNGDDLYFLKSDMEEIGQAIIDTLEAQKEADGWGYNGAYCPDCMTTHGQQIAAMETADDYEVGGAR